MLIPVTLKNVVAFLYSKFIKYVNDIEISNLFKDNEIINLYYE